VIDPFDARTDHFGKGDEPAIPGLDKMVSELLSGGRVIDPTLQGVVVEACREIWPELDDEDVLVGGFRAGTLILLLDSHARLAEAKNFAAKELRERINELLALRNEEPTATRDQEPRTPPETTTSKSLAHAKRLADPARKQKEGNYVTRIHFYLRGTK